MKEKYTGLAILSEGEKNWGKDTCTLLDRERNVFSQFIKRFENLSATAIIRLIIVINDIVIVIIVTTSSSSAAEATATNRSSCNN